MNTVPVKAYNGLSIEDLKQQLLAETDVTNIKEISRQLNAHLQKKDIIRKTELSGLQDEIQKQIAKRVTEKGDCFSNKDLLDYFKTIDDTINKIDADPEALPQIQVNQQLNISMDKPSMSREDKMQVLERVRQIVEQARQSATDSIVQGEYKEINEQ